MTHGWMQLDEVMNDRVKRYCGFDLIAPKDKTNIALRLIWEYLKPILIKMC